MGSGSYGGGGSGGSGAGVRSAIGSGYRSKGGKLESSVKSSSATEKAVREICQGLSKEYCSKMFGSQMIRAVYEHLFTLSVEIFQNKSWSGILKRYNVASGTGCLLEWVNAVLEATGNQESNTKIRETVRVTLEDFLMKALDNDVDRYVSGDANSIIGALDQKTFKSTSGYFLGFLIRRVLERELETLPEVTETQITEAAQVLGDKVINSFENKFLGKNQVTYRDFFRIVQENPGWFLEQLRA
jgi:uncharacterized protein YneF (UPF0154 family)